MTAVNVTNVTVLDNPSMFMNPFQFEISYECLCPLQDGKSLATLVLCVVSNICSDLMPKDFSGLIRGVVADLEWKLIYVGSAEDEKYDQVLESVLVGPVNIGNYRFVFQVLIFSFSTAIIVLLLCSKKLRFRVFLLCSMF